MQSAGRESRVVVLVTCRHLPLRKPARNTTSKLDAMATVSIVNQYGRISVKAFDGKARGGERDPYSDKVEVDQSQSGNRVSVLSHLLPGATADNARVDYEVLVPADASVTLHSTTGPLARRKTAWRRDPGRHRGTVDVREISDGHVHVKTLNGPVTLTNVSDGHVEITSVSGDVALNSVNGPLVRVNSTSGKIHYDGDFGDGGEYSL